MTQENKSDDQSAFNSAPNPDQENKSTQSLANDIPEGLGELVGEGKKYKTVQDAITSIAPAQNHIQKLEAELEELRNKVTEQKTIDDLLEKISSKESNQTQENTTQSSGITEEDVYNILTKKQQQDALTTNLEKVDSQLKEVYGDKAREFVLNKVSELGISDQDLTNLAAKSPQAFYKLVGFQDRKKDPKPNFTGTVNPGNNVSPEQGEKIPVMFGATTGQMIDAWRNAGKQIQT